LRIILLGPQGSGKGTQAELLSQRIHAQHIAMGDIVRSEIGSGSPLGESLRQYNDRGELVPDETILQLIRPRLREGPEWILDGFPRDREQARALDGVLRGEDCPIDKVVALEIPEVAISERLAARRQSKSTGAVYNLVHNPPPPDDPGPFLSRADDAPDKIQRRLELYHALTEPLKQFYEGQGLLALVDANGTIDEVRDRIFRALGVQ
jgi:adenylate kinase